MHELELEGADDRSGRLQAKVGVQPVVQDIAVVRPPARGVRLPGERQHSGPLLLIGDAVHGEQVGHVPLLEAHPAVFHAADLGAGRPDLIAGLLGRDARRLAQLVQLVPEHHAQHCRPWGADRQLATRLNRAHPGSGTLMNWRSAHIPKCWDGRGGTTGP